MLETLNEDVTDGRRSVEMGVAHLPTADRDRAFAGVLRVVFTVRYINGHAWIYSLVASGFPLLPLHAH